MLALMESGEKAGLAPEIVPKPAYLGTEAERAEMVLREVRAAGMSRDMVRKVWDAIDGALQSRITMRAPDPKMRNGWSYQWAPDHPTRLTGARLALAYLAGNPPTQADVRISGSVAPGGNGPMTVESRLAELKAIGVSLRSVVDAIERQAAGEIVDVSQAKACEPSQ